MDTVRALLEELHTALSACPGIIVEDKGPVTAVHIRLIEKARIPSIRKRFSSLVAKHNAGNLLRVTQGKEVMEVWPMVAWDKGRAVEWLLQERHGINWESHVTAIYLGDDKTDEDVFRLLHDRGITVRVGQEALHATAARFVLRSTDEVRMFFDWLAHTLH
jgi:trehalose 6-phosphate phosphatase